MMLAENDPHHSFKEERQLRISLAIRQDYRYDRALAVNELANESFLLQILPGA